MSGNSTLCTTHMKRHGSLLNRREKTESKEEKLPICTIAYIESTAVRLPRLHSIRMTKCWPKKTFIDSLLLLVVALVVLMGHNERGAMHTHIL